MIQVYRGEPFPLQLYCRVSHTSPFIIQDINVLSFEGAPVADIFEAEQMTTSLKPNNEQSRILFTDVCFEETGTFRVVVRVQYAVDGETREADIGRWVTVVEREDEEDSEVEAWRKRRLMLLEGIDLREPGEGGRDSSEKD